MNIWTWTALLIVACFGAAVALGFVSGQLSFDPSLSPMFVLGYTLPFVAVSLAPTGVIAAVTFSVSKSASKAMWVWTLLAVLVVGFLALGANVTNQLTH
jgi:hypothetical protein